MKNVTADIAIIAAGPAGLAAAIAAAESGGSVVVFEKSPVTGGTGNMGMGPLGLGTKIQKEAMIDIDVEKAFDQFMEHTHWRVDGRLVKKYFEKSADTIEWLQEMGVEFFGAAKYFPGSEASWHIVKPESGRPGPRAASAMYKKMTERAIELGVDFHLESPAFKILKEGDAVCGVMAKNKNGEEIEARTKAVIVATGGFGDNVDWIKKYCGLTWGQEIFSFRIPGLMGDGIRMAWEIGAGDTEVGMEIIFQMPHTTDNAPLIGRIFSQPNLLVNRDGERFINEAVMENVTYCGNAILRQRDRTAFSIIDSAIVKHYKRHGLDVLSLVHPHMEVGDFEGEFEESLKSGNPDIKKADTLEELAEKCGLDQEAFLATVEQYNEDCAGRDTVFGKPDRFMKPIGKAPFYAGQFFPSAYGTLGGIKVNHNLEVLTKDHQKIKGFYGAGTDVCTIYGDSYVFTLPGNTMGFALNSGRMAGENAMDYLNSLD